MRSWSDGEDSDFAVRNEKCFEPKKKSVRATPEGYAGLTGLIGAMTEASA